MDKTIKFIEYAQKINRKHTIKLNIAGCKNNSIMQNKNIKIHWYLSKNNPNDIKKLNQLYSKANFFILLSREEALGIVFLEAASYALLIITNKVEGIRTIVKKNGILFNPNDNFYTHYKKFRKLLKNKNYIKYLMSSLKQYKNNNPAKIFDKFTRIICWL